MFGKLRVLSFLVLISLPLVASSQAPGYNKLQDIWVFQSTLLGSWSGGDLVAPNGTIPGDSTQMYNGLPSLSFDVQGPSQWWWQTILAGYFLAHEKEWGILSRTELRVQTGAESFRVPDVTLLSRSAPREQIVTHPPLTVFEILSPEDSMTRTLEKLAEYERMGIPAIWLIEPKTRHYFLYRNGQLTPATVFELPGSAFRVPLAEIAALAD